MVNWAIVVGINNYPERAQQNPLLGAVADACDFADWALDPAGGAVAPERLFFWTHPWPAPPPGRLTDYLAGPLPNWYHDQAGAMQPDQGRPPKAIEITTTIEDAGRAAYGSDFGDDDAKRRVFVFLAGHGIRARTFDRDEETCFLAGDFAPPRGNLTPGLIPCDSFRRALLHKRFDEAIIFTDCCRSITARSSLTAQQVSDFDGEPILPWSIAFAAQDGEPAYETATPPIRGAFSSALMRGLRTHRPGPVGELHAVPLREYVRTSIEQFTDSGQVPNLLCRPDPHGPLIVPGQAPGGGTISNGPVLDVSALAVGTVLILKGGDLQPVPGVAPFTVAGPNLALPPLPVGLYSVEINDGSGRYEIFAHPRQGVVRVA